MSTPNAPAPKEKREKRRLVSQNPRNSGTGCLACSWRKFSNESFREFRKQQEANGTPLPESFSGIVPGYIDGFMVLAQMRENRQVGFVAIPVQHYETVISDANSTYSAVLETIKSELKESGVLPDDVPVEETEEENGI